jgi:hypothetical protein
MMQERGMGDADIGGYFLEPYAPGPRIGQAALGGIQDLLARLGRASATPGRSPLLAGSPD